LDEIDLPIQPWNTRCDLIGPRLAIACRVAGSIRSAFEDIGYKDGIPSQAHRGQHLREELSGWAHEGLTTQIIFNTGSLTDKHDLGLDVADAKDHRMTRGSEMGAAGTGENFCPEFGHSSGSGLRRQGRW
jgi:hypothetical protein